MSPEAIAQFRYEPKLRKAILAAAGYAGQENHASV
jgi:hypothetical protein